MTDLIVDLDHLTTLAGRFGDAASRLGDLPATGPLGVERLDRAWSGYRQRRVDGLRRVTADVDRVAAGLVRTRDAYAAAETMIERGFAR